MSKIQWTEKTWNPTTGCSRVSPGCSNCYAEKMTKRLAEMGQEKYVGLLNDQNRFNSVIKFHEDALLIPVKARKPTTYFVNSMSDLFHENVKDEWIDKIFAVMALRPQHTFQILTKRPERMAKYLNAQYKKRVYEWMGWLDAARGVKNPESVRALHDYTALPNVWLGTSTENQKTADERIPHLLATPAAVRFLSVEPMLEAIDFYPLFALRKNAKGETAPEDDVLGYDLPAIDLAIFGGESGAGARECDLNWIRAGIKQCRNSGIKVFVKQLGKYPVQQCGQCGRMMGRCLGGAVNSCGVEHKETASELMKIRDTKGGNILEFPADLRIREMPAMQTLLT